MMEPGRIKVLMGNGKVMPVECGKLTLSEAVDRRLEKVKENHWDMSATGTAKVIRKRPHDGLEALITGMNKMDVSFEWDVRRTSRKIKKARKSLGRYRRNTKGRRQLKVFLGNNCTKIRVAEMVIDKVASDILRATLCGGEVEHGCKLSTDDLLKKLADFPKRK